MFGTIPKLTFLEAKSMANDLRIAIEESKTLWHLSRALSPYITFQVDGYGKNPLWDLQRELNSFRDNRIFGVDRAKFTPLIPPLIKVLEHKLHSLGYAQKL